MFNYYFYRQLNERLVSREEFMNSKNNRFIPDSIKQSIMSVDPNKNDGYVSEY